jgi:hypothetical protein
VAHLIVSSFECFRTLYLHAWKNACVVCCTLQQAAKQDVLLHSLACFHSCQLSCSVVHASLCIFGALNCITLPSWQVHSRPHILCCILLAGLFLIVQSAQCLSPISNSSQLGMDEAASCDFGLYRKHLCVVLRVLLLASEHYLSTLDGIPADITHLLYVQHSRGFSLLSVL